jgi:hypothetical protein
VHLQDVKKVCAGGSSGFLQAAEKLPPVSIQGAVLKGHDFNRAINALK